MASAVELTSNSLTTTKYRKSLEDGEVSNEETHRPQSAAPVVQSAVKVEGGKGHIDRNKVCPLLLKLYFNEGRHNNPWDFMNKESLKSETHIHTWMDATLSELIIHLQHKNRRIRRSGTILDFQILSPDPSRARYNARDIGSVQIDIKGPDDLKTLSQCRFSIGDVIDVCIKYPKN